MLWSSFLQEQALSGSPPEIYPRSFNNIRLREKTEFYKEESDHEVIVIAVGGLGECAPPAGRFSHYGSFSLPLNFSPPHESLSSPFCYLKWDTK